MPIYSSIFGQMGMGLKTVKTWVMMKININIVFAVSKYSYIAAK